MQYTILRRGRGKKPKDFPKRPMSAYNFFFKHERQKMLMAEFKKSPVPPHLMQRAFESGRNRPHRKRHGKISFQDMVHTIATKWKSIDPELKKKYKEQARIAKQQYVRNIIAWKRRRGQSVSSTQTEFVIQLQASPSSVSSGYDFADHASDDNKDAEPMPINHPNLAETDFYQTGNQATRDLQCDRVGTLNWLVSQLDSDFLDFFLDNFACG